MKCTCGHVLGPVMVDERGYANLPEVRIQVVVRRCEKCGAEEVGYPKIEALNRFLAGEVARKKARLVPAEIRFLRTYLGLSSKMLAETIGVAAETVSRWEHGKEEMGKPVERLLRVLAIAWEPVTAYEDSSLKELKNFATKKAAPLRMKAVHSSVGGWELAPAV
jgi:putative zinc finger/helix-turn-helix YgiT family protein